MMWAIRTQQLGKQYDKGTWGVRDVSLEFKFGTFIGLLGANGAGKSTLIHLLCGAVIPTEGNIERGGDPPATAGWCSQRLSIDWYMNVENNVILGPRLAGQSRAASRANAHEALELVGLSGSAHKFADELSGGQQQRVQIARVLASRPHILLLDEPTAGLDAEASEILLDHLRSLADSGATVVVSSHDIGLLESRCDLVLLLAKSEVVTFEEPRSFLNRFSNEEVIEISYTGQLDAETIGRVEQNVLRIVDKSPLRVVVQRGTLMRNILAPLEGVISVQDIRRQTPGLREAYLSYARNEHGGRTLIEDS